MLGSDCLDWSGTRVRNGHTFIPYKDDPCTLCTCRHGYPVDCIMTICQPPPCADYEKVEGQCCEVRCRALADNDGRPRETSAQQRGSAPHQYTDRSVHTPRRTDDRSRSQRRQHFQTSRGSNTRWPTREEPSPDRSARRWPESALSGANRRSDTRWPSQRHPPPFTTRWPAQQPGEGKVFHLSPSPDIAVLTRLCCLPCF